MFGFDARGGLQFLMKYSGTGLDNLSFCSAYTHVFAGVKSSCFASVSNYMYFV